MTLAAPALRGDTTRTAVVGRRLSLPLLALAVDLLVIVLVVVGAWVGRSRLPLFTEVGDLDRLVGVVGLPIAIGWLGIIAAHGGYAAHLMGAGTQEYKVVVRATLVLAGAAGVVSFLMRFQFSRGFFFLLILLGIPLLVVGRHLLRRAIHALRRDGHLTHRVVVAGTSGQVDDIVRVLQRERWLGYDVLGAVLPTDEPRTETPLGVPVLGSTMRTSAIVTDAGADIVLFASGAVPSAREMRRAAWELDDLGVTMMIVPSLTDVATDRVRVRPAAGLHFMELDGPRAQRAARIGKRAFDIVGAGACILLASPVLVATAIAVKLHDGGPVLFRQRRVGRGGDLFECLKFRSMVVDADRMKTELAARNKHDADHVLFKDEHDPRITPPGRFIRRFSIDETPQFFNVLRGDMSLVGPRPSLPEEVERYTEDVRTRLAVRPGVTGLWQVSGRSDLSWEDSVRLDLYYVDNWSLVQDLAILWRTAAAVVSGRGAY